MDFNFSLYQPKRAARMKTSAPEVEIRPNGRIFFNQDAAQLLANSPYCMLGYDPDKRAIGLIPYSEPDRNAFTVRYTSKGAYVGAKKFFKFFSALPETSIYTSPQKVGDYLALNC